MFIRSIRIRNFMIHLDTTITFQPLTVFVGPNSSGKSAIFDALLNFSMLSRGSLRQAFGPYPYSFKATISRSAAANSSIRYDAVLARSSTDEEMIRYEVSYAQTSISEDSPNFNISKERISAADSTLLFDRQDAEDFPIARGLHLSSDRTLLSALRSRNETDPETSLFDYLCHEVSRFNKFRLDPASLSSPSRLPEIGGDGARFIPRLGYHGEDLPTVLNYLSETKDGSYDIIRNHIRDLIPEFDDFDYSSVGTDRVAFSVRFRDGRREVPAVRLSSGLLSFIGLIALVCAPNRPPVLMIEEPENGLTPQAIRIFYSAVRQLTMNEDISARSQVLISSHSPFVICEAWNGEDREFIHQVTVKDGKSIVRKFSDVILEQGIQLSKVDGVRKHLSLGNAEEIMSGRLSG